MQAQSHFHASKIYKEMYPQTVLGKRGAYQGKEEGSAVRYSTFAAQTTGLKDQTVRDLVRIGRYIDDEFLATIVGTEMGNLWILLNICSLLDQVRKDETLK